MTLEHDVGPPYRLLDSSEVARVGPYVLRRDRVALDDGTEAFFMALDVPGAAFVVPLDEDGTTVLVRQWRQAWGRTSWEVPAGTMEEGEAALACAQRELVEEAGLRAERWTPLGATVGGALLTNQQHHFLAEGLAEVPRAPERYERHMVIRRIPLAEAVEAAMSGEIVHAGSVAALARAASHLARRPK